MTKVSAHARTQRYGSLNSKGRRLLVHFLEATSLSREQLARRLGCTEEFVGLCVNAKRTPRRYELVESFRRVCSIPPEAWDDIEQASPAAPRR